MIEKAKLLALNGEAVLFVLWYCESDFDYAPILLYNSLYNEIEEIKKEIESDRGTGMITLKMMSSLLDLLHSIKPELNLNVFVDEYVINSKNDLLDLRQLIFNRCHSYITKHIF